MYILEKNGDTDRVHHLEKAVAVFTTVSYTS